MITQEKGQVAEEKALDYLIKQRLKLIMKNYHCRFGEIDLIMHDSDHLVFVEVRSRVSNQFGGAISSVTYAKKQKILKAAACFIMEHQKYNQFAFRFDVVCIDGKSTSLNWVKDAFGANY